VLPDAGAPRARGALKAVILLAGHVGRDALADAVGRSFLDLPVAAGLAVLDVWADHLREMLASMSPAPRVIVAVDRRGPSPRVGAPGPRSRIRFEVARDRTEFRGTAGVVKDLARGFDDDDRVLVVVANQLQRAPFRQVAEALLESGEGVSVVRRRGSDFTTAFLLRCGRLRDVSDVGFVDLKQQALSGSHGPAPLRVVRWSDDSAMPMRTIEEYVGALRAAHGRREPEGAFAETWSPTFSIVEAGAHIEPGAVVVDSVVLAGARVEADAVVSRSIVGPRGVVRRGRRVADSLVVD